MIELAQLRVVKEGKTVCRVDELHVAPGEQVGVWGPNGSGKTTLLKVLAGLEHDYLGGCAVSVAQRERVYVHQDPYLFCGTVLANVMYGLRAHGATRAAAEAEARRWLDKLEVGGLARRRANSLSGGEQQRVALARALALNPRLLLLDEPLADLDAAGRSAVARVLDELPGATLVIASPTADWPRPLRGVELGGNGGS